MQTGTVVRYAVPANAREDAVRFVVVEDRGDRLLVETLCDWPLKPQCCFAASEFSPVAFVSSLDRAAQILASHAVMAVRS